MAIATFEQRLEAIDQLPSLPLVLQQIQKVITNERTSMAQISAVVAKDQALTSRAIRLVNSAWYGRTTRVTSIQQVLVTLGLKTLNTLMLGLTVTKLFPTSDTRGFNMRSFWEHAFGTALLAKKLAHESGKKANADEYFVGGLLHDLGKLVLEQFFHDEYVSALQLMREKKQSLLVSEREIFDSDHADTGAWLGKKWRIPRQIHQVMELHHRSRLPGELLPEEKNLIRIVQAADALCISENIGDSGEAFDVLDKSHLPDEWSGETIDRIVNETRSEITQTIQQWSS